MHSSLGRFLLGVAAGPKPLVMVVMGCLFSGFVCMYYTWFCTVCVEVCVSLSIEQTLVKDGVGGTHGVQDLINSGVVLI